ncbi:MAG: DNA-processing protein DprA, partial [Candidatus Thermoplasmatota archaeon]|nr:DNA-processing protein DprA [Candidatus Thermoplasmatota archaeon]
GSSVAIVGTGLDRIYPARNKALAHRLAENGLIVSEFALGTPPRSGPISRCCRRCCPRPPTINPFRN